MGREPVDVRKGLGGSRVAVIGTVDEDPQSGHLFVFLNMRRNRMKALVRAAR